MLHRLAPLAVAVSLPLSGCYATSSSMAATGEPLRADIKTNEERSSRYGMTFEPGTYQWLDGLYQGETKIEDELDFYHVAGDTEREAGIIEHREKKNLATVVSWGGGAVGAAIFAGAFGYLIGTGKLGGDNVDTDYFSSQEGQIVMGAATAGGIIAAGAPMAAFFVLGPRTDTSIELPANSGEWTYELRFPREDAAAAAAAYNEKLQGSSTPSEAPAPAEAAPATP